MTHLVSSKIDSTGVQLVQLRRYQISNVNTALDDVWLRSTETGISAAHGFVSPGNKHYYYCVALYQRSEQSAHVTDLSPSPSVGLCACVCVCVCLSVCQSVWKVYCGKTADWIRMPFWSRMRDGCIRWVAIVDGKRQFWG